MKTWPALLVAPMLALTDQTVAYVLVPWSCAHQQILPVHLAHALFLVAALIATIPSWHAFEAERGAPKSDVGEVGDRMRFLSISGLLVGVLSMAVIAAMWFPVWVLSPCYG
jgi:hypothetical protein